MTDLYPEDLNFVRKIGPLPMFWGSDTNSMDKIEKAGFNDYYIVAQEKIALPSEANKAQTFKYRPSVFLVTKTVMGRSIVVADEKTLDLFQSTNESAHYSMPKMPWDMIQKMDHFFRTVHKKHQSEAILVLVYDPEFFTADDPTAGWRPIAPKQSNTAGSCDYDPSSVQLYKKEHEIIMGTIHSHPEMSAFFSGTDHKDQDDWDGIHITQAWKGNGPTEYHIAMILGGKDWILKEHQVFDLPPLPEVELEEVDSWVENVEKKAWTNAHHSSTAVTSSGTNYINPTSIKMPLATQSFIPSEKVRAIKLPADAPDPRTTIIVAEYPESILTDKAGTVSCRFCSMPLLSTSILARRCLACTGWILLQGETIEDLCNYRAANSYSYDLYIDSEKSPHPIVIFEVNEEFSEDQRLSPSSPKA